MTFRQLSARYLEPGTIGLMVLGIVFLCQPWSRFLHVYGLTVTLVGLVGFSVFSKIRPLSDDERER
jgi:hypothetical protein